MTKSTSLFGSNLRSIIRRKGLTYTQAARDIGITLSYLNQLMRGERDPSLEVIKDICAALDISSNEVIEAPNEFVSLGNLSQVKAPEEHYTITKSEVKSLLKDTVLETIQTVRDLENEKLRLKLEKSEKRVAELEAKLAHLKTLADLPMIEDLAPAWRNATDLLKYSVLLIMTGKEKYLNLVADKYAEAFPTVEAALRAFGGIRKL